MGELETDSAQVESKCEQLVREVLATNGATVLSPARSYVSPSTTRFDRAVCGAGDEVSGGERQGCGRQVAGTGEEPRASSAAFYLRAKGADDVDVGSFEDFVLRYVREELCGGILRVANDRESRAGPAPKGPAASGSPTVGSGHTTLSKAAYADEFPSLGMAASKKNILEARISNSPLGGQHGSSRTDSRILSGSGRSQDPQKVQGEKSGDQGSKQGQGRRRIVPTAIQSVQVNERFVNATRAHNPGLHDGTGKMGGNEFQKDRKDEKDNKIDTERKTLKEVRGDERRRIQPMRVSAGTDQGSSPTTGAQPMTPTVSRLQRGMDRMNLQAPGSTPRVRTGGDGAALEGDLSASLSRGVSSTFDSPLAFTLEDDGDDEDHGTDDEDEQLTAISALAKLHGRILECSPRIFLISELSLVLDVLVIDPNCNVEETGGDDRDQDRGVDHPDPKEQGMHRIDSGTDAISYASTVLVNAGSSLIDSLGVKVLRELLSYLVMRTKSMANRPSSVYRLKRMVAGALREAEPSSFLHSSSPSTGNFQTSGRLLGLTGLNVFLSGGSDTLSRTAEAQRRLSNRETFRDSWFKLMRDAVNRSSSLDTKSVMGTKGSRASEETGIQTLENANAGDLTVLKLIQEESSQLLRSLRVDNYEPFAELFTAAVLQAAVTGETIMDDELTGIAQQNLSRFQSLNKRFQMSSSSSLAGNADRGRARSSLSKSSKKGQVDYTAEHALRVSSEFPKSLRPFVLFLEATDSHRLDLSVAHTMRVKLGSILRSSAESSRGGRVLEGEVFSVDELCISSSALAGFLGYFSFTKGRDPVDELSPVIQKLRRQGEYDGSHFIDVMSVFLESFGAGGDGFDVINGGGKGASGNVATASGQPGALFRTLPWICRYLKMLSWDTRQASSPYFKAIFGLLKHLRGHRYLQPSGRLYRGVGSLCLRGMLDNLMWIFPDAFDGRMSTNVVIVDDKIDATLGEDVLWANENLGRRYLEVAVPDLSYLESVISVKAFKSWQTMKAVKKIRPTAPISVAGSSRLDAWQGRNENGGDAGHLPSRLALRSSGKEDPADHEPGARIGSSAAPNTSSWDRDGEEDKDRADPSSRSKDDTIRELERVFLDQYSTSSRITDVKLRDFVTWCSDAVARQGIAAGLDVASNLRRQKVLLDIVMEIKESVRQKKEKASKDILQDACAAIEDHFAAKYYAAIKGPALEALKEKTVSSSKRTSDILLPHAWGEHVRMTAAAIVARRAQSAATRQLLAELKRLGRSNTKYAIDATLKGKT